MNYKCFEILIKSIVKQQKKDNDNSVKLVDMFNMESDYPWINTPMIEDVYDALEQSFNFEGDDIFDIIIEGVNEIMMDGKEESIIEKMYEECLEKGLSK